MSIESKLVNAISDIEGRISGITDQPFKDKWVSILGDSISTFNGWIPEGNETKYPYSTVDNVNKTWWWLLLTKLGAKLCVNNSWSGRAVSSESSVDSAAQNAITKLHREAGQTYINLDGTTEVATQTQNPDFILILLGINDFNGDVPVGTVALNKNKVFSNDDFAKSYEALIMNITGSKYPSAHIYCLNIAFASNKYGFLANNGGGSKLIEYRKAIEEIARAYECQVLHLDRLGIHEANISAYSPDKLHPFTGMMRMIAAQCYSEMMASNCNKEPMNL